MNSLFAIKAGEIGIIGLPAGDFRRYFDFVDPKTEFERSMPGLVMGVRVSDRSNREALEKILMKGGRLSSKIGSAGGSLAFSGERTRGKVTPKGDDNQSLQDLGVELFGDDGQTTMRTGITVLKGSPTFFRSSYPDPEVFLIIVGTDEESPES
ncbi:hypothetical protein ACFQY0_05000 [Haloferula chungangensis]|uniref:Uncharacterized protein n=1 Tax=Haloferula chungangensis TaxID=1048331 RepID=A0ABW2L4V4_9BACT